MKVFVDANVFFAAARSLTGGSAFILELAKQKKIRVITVLHALDEAEKNIQKKLDNKAILTHYQNLTDTKPIIQPLADLSLAEIVRLEKFVPLKDIPILLGALQSKSQFLVTLDRKDFLDNEKLKTLQLPFQIVRPGEFLKWYLKYKDK